MNSLTRQHDKVKYEISRKVLSTLLEIAKDKGVFVDGLFENSKISYDAIEILYKLYQTSKDLEIPYSILIKSVINFNRDSLSIRHFKTAEKCYEIWKKHSLTLYKENKVSSILSSKYESDCRIFTKFLEKFGDDEVAFSLGLGIYTAQWILDFILSIENPDKFIEILQSNDKKLREVQCLIQRKDYNI